MVSTVILAAGTGSRCNLGYNKLLYKIKGKMLIEYTLEKFSGHEIVLVVSEQEYSEFSQRFRDLKVVVGGKTRQQSVINGVKNCKYENVLVHDGARVFVDETTITNVVNELNDNVAVVPCVKVKDSIKDNCGSNIDRSNLNIAQTPQGIKKSIYLDCVNEECTDDVTVLEKCGYNVKVVEGSYQNSKITTIEDIKYAHFLIGGENDI